MAVPRERVTAASRGATRAWVAGLVEHGHPEPMARMLLGMFHAARAGEFDVVDPTLERLLGRPPVAIREALAAGLT